MSSSSLDSSRWTEVALVGMRFHVCVGILPHERNVAQPLEIDLVVRHAAAREGVLDYRRMYEATTQVVHGEACLYLESIAEALAAQALLIDGVEWCRVAVRKPHVALGGPLGYAQVMVERGRG
jgi:dihydroneopterin aldolase